MRIDRRFRRWVSAVLAALLLLPGGVLAQGPGEGEAKAKAFSQEQLDQLLAPIALYPDSLLTQMLMASTYPLEVVKANNWLKQNKELKGDALTAALEKQEWDPSIKSLVNFPQVLQMMTDKLDWTQRLGDAFLAQQKDVLDTVQKLRKKAYDAGNLKSNKEQKVSVDNTTQVIVVESPGTQVVYVPTYNPTVVYGTWWYPAYPPYYVYPAPYTGAAFFTGVAIGVAWGYAWGHCNWHGGSVNINYNQNININRNIDRGKYASQQPSRGGAGGSGQGKWQHNPSHRQGVAYRDSATARQYGQTTGRPAPSSREARGYDGRGGSAPGAGTMDRGGAAGGGRGGTYDRGGGSAFGGSGSGSFDRSASQRGQASRGGSMGGGRGGGGRGGGGRGGGRR